MDIAVILALTVLGCVFVFSFILLVIMCRRRYEYNRLLVDQSLRFSKLRQDNVDDIIQLSPHISQALNSNQWVYDVSGILEHCVAVLKLCHTLTDKLAKIPLNAISPQLNDVICQATAKVVPRFDDLLKSMAAPNVDVRLIEARVVALVTTCWSLVSPFYLMNPKYKEVFGNIIKEMENHQQFLQLAVEQASENAHIVANGGQPKPVQGTPSSGSRRTPPEKRNTPIITGPPPNSSTQTRTPTAARPPEASVSLRQNEEARKELLPHSDEAPADPSTS